MVFVRKKTVKEDEGRGLVRMRKNPGNFQPLWSRDKCCRGKSTSFYKIIIIITTISNRESSRRVHLSEAFERKIKKKINFTQELTNQRKT